MKTSSLQSLSRSVAQSLIAIALLFAILHPPSSILAENVNVTDHQLKTTKPVPVTVVPPASGSPTPAAPVKIADGDDVALGAKANSAATTDAGTFSLISLVKRGLQSLTTIATAQTSGTQKAIAVPTQGAPTDRSGTITTGGTSQTLAAALTTRTYIEIQNISDETMYINFGAAAVVDSNSFKIVAGGSYINGPHYCPTGTITIIGATTGKKFVAKEG